MPKSSVSCVYEGVLESSTKRSHQNTCSCRGRQLVSNLAENDGGVRSNTGLLVVVSLGEVAQKIVVFDSGIKMRNQRQHSLYSGLSNERGCIGETGDKLRKI